MKKTLVFLLMLTMAKTTLAQYKPDEQGSTLTFNIKNLGFNVPGEFKGFDGTINFDSQNLAVTNFDVTVNAATINTDNSLRDGHLREDGFFDVGHYPRIRLVSTKISSKGGGYLFAGNLTIKGKTQAIAFPFTSSLTANGFIFKASFKINRKDFGVGGTSTVANELEVMLNVLVKKV
jgi:polyisoprenoid-binding protein YceI